MSCLCLCFIFLQHLKQFLLYSAKKKEGMRKPSFVQKEPPWGRLHKTMISSNQRAQRRKKGGSGCKGDGIETGNGWARFELGRIGFNAAVMAADGFNPFAGFSFPHRFLIKSIPVMTSKHA